jgi:hypothetical protein
MQNYNKSKGFSRWTITTPSDAASATAQQMSCGSNNSRYFSSDGATCKTDIQATAELHSAAETNS